MRSEASSRFSAYGTDDSECINSVSRGGLEQASHDARRGDGQGEDPLPAARVTALDSDGADASPAIDEANGPSSTRRGLARDRHRWRGFGVRAEVVGAAGGSCTEELPRLRI